MKNINDDYSGLYEGPCALDIHMDKVQMLFLTFILELL